VEKAMTDFDIPTMLKAIEDFEKGDYTAAIPVLLLHSEAGSPKAQRHLADAYHLGMGVERDGKKAAELYLKVGEQNIREDGLSAVAYNNLATLYFTGGPGLEPNMEQGRKYLALARELGFEM